MKANTFYSQIAAFLRSSCCKVMPIAGLDNRKSGMARTPAQPLSSRPGFHFHMSSGPHAASPERTPFKSTEWTTWPSPTPSHSRTMRLRCRCPPRDPVGYGRVPLPRSCSTRRHDFDGRTGAPIRCAPPRTRCVVVCRTPSQHLPHGLFLTPAGKRWCRLRPLFAVRREGV